jgi:uncharacterized protein YceH (UPF0502 family)
MNEQDVERIVGRATSEARRHFDVVQDLTAQFVETRAMIKLSYSELDRRVTKLEDSVVRLEARVERLESAAQR